MHNEDHPLPLYQCYIQVQKIDIAYSRTAKKIDVKKVKRAMWNIMSSTSNTDKVRSVSYTYSFLTHGKPRI
jgi:hypothetical protein